MPERLFRGDFPPNPLEKPGYRLDFHDEFDGPSLDPERWVPFYLPHWSSRAASTPRYTFEGGSLVLQITHDQPPWCQEFDGEVRCSSIQTGAFAGPVGSSSGQHRFNPANRVREAQANLRKYVPQYGYFEMRARAVAHPSNHVALWMIGYEDIPERSGEVAICEIMGAEVGPTEAQVGYGLHPWGDPQLVDEFYQDVFPLDATRYHLYALEWTPDQLEFFLDNVKTRTIRQSPQYPMQFMLSIYERPTPAAGNQTAAYPKQFVIDYLRAYQPLNGYPVGPK